MAVEQNVRKKIKVYVWGLLFAVPLFLVGACTNFKLDALKERTDDNFSGALTNPGNITIATPTNFTFAAMGDSHVGGPNGEVLKQIVSQSTAAGDSFLIVAGDLTDNGDAGQYRQFTSVMSQYSATYRVAIGNHDIFFNGWDNYKASIGRSMYSFDAGNIHFVMLDSANGVLGLRQLLWMDQDLQATTQPLKIVVSHFPPWEGFFSSMYKMSSDEEAAILKDTLNKNGVQLMLAGHYHGYDEIQLGVTKFVVSGGANNIPDPGQHKHYVQVRVNGTTLTTTKIEMP